MKHDKSRAKNRGDPGRMDNRSKTKTRTYQRNLES